MGAEKAFFRTKEYIKLTRELKHDDSESYLELNDSKLINISIKHWIL